MSFWSTAGKVLDGASKLMGSGGTSGQYMYDDPSQPWLGGTAGAAPGGAVGGWFGGILDQAVGMINGATRRIQLPNVQTKSEISLSPTVIGFGLLIVLLVLKPFKFMRR
jgi:hypothetical protein